LKGVIKHLKGVIKHRMRFRRYVPPKPLSFFVEDFWQYENYTTDLHVKERILPTGTIEMVFNLQDDELRIYDPILLDRYRRYSGALLSGPYQRCFVTDTAEETSVMGVHFKAAGAYPFFRVSSEELTDVHLDLELLWGPSSRILRERLCCAGSPTQKFRILEQALLAHLLRPSQHHYAVDAALSQFRQPGPHLMIREMAREIGLSQRRLIRVFSAEVGLTPKLFSRIYDSSEPPTWQLKAPLRTGAR
jgi:AraC-like DNA-binding protein